MQRFEATSHWSQLNNVEQIEAGLMVQVASPMQLLIVHRDREVDDDSQKLQSYEVDVQVPQGKPERESQNDFLSSSVMGAHVPLSAIPTNE